MTLIEHLIHTARQTRPEGPSHNATSGEPSVWDSIETYSEVLSATPSIKIEYYGSTYNTLLELDKVLVDGSFSFTVVFFSRIVFRVIETVTPDTVRKYVFCDDGDNNFNEVLDTTFGNVVTERTLSGKPLIDVLIFDMVPDDSGEHEARIVELVKLVKPEFAIFLGD